MDHRWDWLKGIGAALHQVVGAAGRWLASLKPSPGWERQAAATVGLVILLLAGFYGYDSRSGLGAIVDILAPVIVAALGYLLILTLGQALVGWLLRLPLIVWLAVITAVIAGTYAWGQRTWLHWVLNLGLVLSAACAGVAWHAIRRDWTAAPLRKKVFISLLGTLGVAGILTVAVLLFYPGRPAQPLLVDPARGPALIAAPDLSQPGNYPVSILTYGSGTDRRPEYGEQTGLISGTVDASPYVSFSGFNARYREWFFGFDEDAYPLNGWVWYPVGEGPFPLVLVVHGNHSMTEFSDPGYAYLCELLASRGLICVSVDQNFLNGGFAGRASGENDARAWLLLEHLALWRGWQDDPASPFYRQVDFDRIALIGHSRGGEAVALAATFNRLDRYPGNANIRWKYDFGIRAVVAIAPVDEQWRPADHPNPLQDLSYLVLQGSHDADLYYFDGIQQYQRAAFTDPDGQAFKAAVYIYRANHGQFNTVWRAVDKTGSAGLFINRRALLPPEDQRQIAKTLISAFLAAAVQDQREYRSVFQDLRLAGDWLPETGYITQYEDYGLLLAAGYEEDIDPETITLSGGEVRTASLSRWREQAMRFRDGDLQDNHAVRLGWSSNQASYSLILPSLDEITLTPETLLVFQAADGRDPENVSEGLDFSVVLIDTFGHRAALRLSDILPLQAQFSAEILRLGVWNESYFEESSEPVFQTYRIPLERFVQANPRLLIADLLEVRFAFDQTASGTVFLDGIGFDLSP
jgi:dienelactone hydrolase